MKTISTKFYLLLLVGGLLFVNCESSEEEPVDPPLIKPKVLVFTKTEGYRHESIESGIAAIKKLGQESDFEVITSEDASQFTDIGLKTFAAIVFLNTTGDILDSTQQAAMERFIRTGKGFVGVHSATDTEFFWGWYGQLVGAFIYDHPEIQAARLPVRIRDHVSTRHLPAIWERTDEWYNFRVIEPSIQVLIEIDESSYEGGNHDGNHPIAWYQEFDGGRSFYTAGGHTEASYQEHNFLEHLRGGILYAIGNE